MPNHWLSVMTIDKDSKVKPLNIMETLEKENIDSRPVWKPMHLQPVFKEYDFITAKMMEHQYRRTYLTEEYVYHQIPR